MCHFLPNEERRAADDPDCFGARFHSVWRRNAHQLLALVRWARSSWLLRKTLDREALSSSLSSTVETTAMVFFILIGASLFSLVFRGYGGDELVAGIFEHMPGGVAGALQS